MEIVFANRETPKDQSHAGAAYVSAREKGGTKYDKILISKSDLCGHQNRICVECASEWAQDYDLMWSRTAGGRKLKAELEVKDG